MSRRTSGVLATLALLTTGLAAVNASPANAGIETEVPACASHAAPCLQSFKRDGVTVNPAAYRVVWNEQQPTAGFYSWYFEKWNPVGSFWNSELGDDEVGHTYTATFDFGSFNPRTLGGTGSPATSTPVHWSTVGGHSLITISASPVVRVLGCTSGDPATCPTTATDEVHGALFEVVNDGRWFGGSTAEHAKIAGFYNLRNTEVGGDAPVITTNAVTGDRALVFTLQNSHEDTTHTVFHGFEHLRLPNTMLRDVYGIPDPDTMTATSLTPVLSSGAGTITLTPEPGHRAMLVDITGVTFSKRTAKILLGTIVPTRPARIIGKRKTRHKAYVDFSAAAARGARPTGYLTRCSRPGGATKTVRTRYSAATVTGLTAGKKYTCHARAISRAGYGPWSPTVRV